MSVTGKRYLLFISSATIVWRQSARQANKDHQQQGAAEDRGDSQLFSHASQAICRQHARHGKSSIRILSLTTGESQLRQLSEL